MVIETANKCSTYSCTLLVDGIKKRVCHIFDALHYPVTHTIWFQIDINSSEFFSVIWKMFE